MEQFFGLGNSFFMAFGGTLLYKNLSPVLDVDASSLAHCVIGVARFMQNERLKKMNRNAKIGRKKKPARDFNLSPFEWIIVRGHKRKALWFPRRIVQYPGKQWQGNLQGKELFSHYRNKFALRHRVLFRK